MFNPTNDNAEGVKTRELLRLFHSSRVGIVGGGHFCRKLLRFLIEDGVALGTPVIIGVSDINPQAEGIQYARERGIYTTTDFRELLALKGLELILEITRDTDLSPLIRRLKPDHVQLMDHYHARGLWDALQLENLRFSIIEDFRRHRDNPAAVEKLFVENFENFDQIITRRNNRCRQIEMELVENQKSQVQVIQGSTIPTFVINAEHVITHWNKALEALSGCKAEEMVGTNRQWAPFWKHERPTMADVILDQTDEAEIHALYGNQWRKSALIENGYEAEIFFPLMGSSGKWLWFTAAPINAPDGTIVGVIETLWDKTADKRAEEERERHTRGLSALLAVYTALSAPFELGQRLEAALAHVQRFSRADDVRIYTCKEPAACRPAFRRTADQRVEADVLTKIAAPWLSEAIENKRSILFSDIDPNSNPELAPMVQLGFDCLGLIPICAKEQKVIGVLLLAGRTGSSAACEEHHLLELIANRIGLAIENDELQSQYIKSEEKYRSLFNNDPNPIFTLQRPTLKILDVNERAVDCYGRKREELVGTSFMQLAEPENGEVAGSLAQLQPGQSILFSKKRHLRKNGALFFVNINAARPPRGESDELIVTTTDITESVKKEAQLIQASKMTTLGLMAAGMAHEINQPLNVIQICADIILKMIRKGQTIPPDELGSIAGDIVTNVERATGIIRHVRNFARQSEVVKSRVNVNAPIRDLLKVMGHQIKAHQIVLDLDLDQDIPLIMAEHNRLEQVFINLVTNAIDAMDEKAAQPEHAAMVKKLTIRSRSQNGKVIVTVEDNGIGMSDDNQHKIFEPFYTTKQIGKGTGLGVSISYNILKDYEGTIDIQSRVGYGTTFTLTFPEATNVS